MEGIYIHYRPGSSPSAPKIDGVRPWDVAALILKCLNMPIPSYFDGTPKTGYA
jgi:hypothetical protein